MNRYLYRNHEEIFQVSQSATQLRSGNLAPADQHAVVADEDAHLEGALRVVHGATS